jgi:cation:H+ antiporter
MAERQNDRRTERQGDGVAGDDGERAVVGEEPGGRGVCGGSRFYRAWTFHGSRQGAGELFSGPFMFSLTGFLDDTLGLGHPLTYLAVFLAASLLLVWRLEAMLDRGMEGTALGAVVMPICSGLGNLLFVAVARERGVPAEEVAVNALGNNLTNLLLILPGVALFATLSLRFSKAAGGGEGKAGAKAKARSGRKKSGGKAGPDAETKTRLHALALFLTLGAAAAFALIAWALALDGKLDRGDGLALIGLFVLWQGFHLYDVRKHQLTQRQSFSPLIIVDALLALGAAWLMLESLDWLVSWLKARPEGSLGADHLGWVTAWLMVLPNAALAAYYAWRSRADIVYASQVGDGHICIPLCLGLAAAISPFAPPAWFADALLVLAGAAGFHALLVAVFGGLPRILAVLPIAAYAWCLREGLS